MSDPIDDAVAASSQPGIRKLKIGLGRGMLALELPKQIRRDRNRALSRILVPAN